LHPLGEADQRSSHRRRFDRAGGQELRTSERSRTCGHPKATAAAWCRNRALVAAGTDGHHTWTELECATFEARWSLGTRERVAFDVLLYTGLRRGDALRLGRAHVKNATIRTENTGEIVTIPILLPAPSNLCRPGRVDIYRWRERPADEKGVVREACRKAWIPGSAHGLRKCGATRAANN